MGNFAFDIETDTKVNGLDPAVAEILSIAVWSPTISIVFDGGTEAGRLANFLALLDDLEPSIALTWNGSVFDGPFLMDRAAIYGIDTGFTVTPDPTIVPKYDFLPGHTVANRFKFRQHQHADVAYAYRDYAINHPQLGPKGWGLKPVSASFNIDMIEVDRKNIHLLTQQENADYNLSDSRGTYLLGERLGADLEHWVDQVLLVA